MNFVLRSCLLAVVSSSSSSSSALPPRLVINFQFSFALWSRQHFISPRSRAWQIYIRRHQTANSAARPFRSVTSVVCRWASSGRATNGFICMGLCPSERASRQVAAAHQPASLNRCGRLALAYYRRARSLSPKASGRDQRRSLVPAGGCRGGRCLVRVFVVGCVGRVPAFW